MASEAEFVEAFGEDADYVDVPEDVLDGESLLDKCLASCKYHSARKISVPWRGQTFTVNTAAVDQKVIALMDNMLTVTK